jgi:hypothetical protein
MTAISMILRAIHEQPHEIDDEELFLAIEMDFLPSSSSTLACTLRAH